MWGRINYKDMNCNSRITVQFRDMSMNLTYIENDAVPEYNGFISKRSGNIPIIDVECESLTLNKNMNGMSSTEFSYKDAQDDVDLMVGKSLFSVPVSIEGNRKKKYYRFRNFSEFTIIGSNKKGYGVEEHYFSKEMLNIEDSDEEE